MEEKVIIKDIRDTGKTYRENPIIEITLADGRKGVCFNEKAKSFIEGQEVAFDIKESDKTNGERKYYFNIPKSTDRSERKGFTRRDYQFEKKKTAIEVSKDLVVNGKLTYEQLFTFADNILEWLNK